MEFLAREPALYQQVQLLLQFAGGGHIAGGGGLEAYLAYMAARLFACRSLVLKETGSLYLHCDPTAGHYLKLLLDAIFGEQQNFISQIVWNYGTPSGKGDRPERRLSSLMNCYWCMHQGTANTLTIGSTRHIQNKYVNDWFRHTDDDGRKYRTRSRKGRIIRQYLDESPAGVPLSNTWTDIMQLYAAQRDGFQQLKRKTFGYPTQKPLALLERIIKASSNPGDLVLDPFCGCGTAVEAAQQLGRRWIGIDVEPLAVDLMARRLRERCGISPRISGIPYDFDQAQRLAENAPYEFERWAIRLVPGAQPNFKQSGDGGLDGRAVVNVEKRPQPLYGFQVKGGQNVGRPAADAFSGALTQHSCAAGLLVVLNERNARRIRHAIGSQERVQLNGWQGPRISVWSVEDWFASGLQCTVQRPSLLGDTETLELLRPQDWQRRLGI